MLVWSINLKGGREEEKMEAMLRQREGEKNIYSLTSND